MINNYLEIRNFIFSGDCLDVIPTTCYLEKVSQLLPHLKESDVKNCQDIVSIFNSTKNGHICNAWWSTSGICEPTTLGQVMTTCQRSCGICDRGSDS